MSVAGQSIVEKPNVDFLACLRAEVEALNGLVSNLSEEQLNATSPCHQWRVIDLLVHLYFVDWMAYLSLTGPDAYQAQLKNFIAATDGEGGATAHYGRMSGHEYTVVPKVATTAFPKSWHENFVALAAAFERHDHQAPVNWFGRTMKVQRLISARQMEVFCYGQDIYDAVGIRHGTGDHIYPVAEFGVRTFQFSFQNRGLTAPGPAPFVQLSAPSGRIWQWNDPSQDNRIEGPATDFCLVATQRRNIADTSLVATGETARRWMAITQTIGGEPTDPPAPGERL